jgi:hypothetical protein
MRGCLVSRVGHKPHESLHRKLLAAAYGEHYEAFRSLGEATRAGGAVVILDGDGASQIYVVCRADEVACTPDALTRLLLDLDQLAWCGRNPGAARVYYERRRTGDVIYGGTGGARVTAGPWVHTQFERLGLRTAICDVLAGREAALAGHEPTSGNRNHGGMEHTNA